MREASVTVRNIDGEALGLEEELAVFREAGLEDVDVVTCEGSRGVVRIHVAGAVDESGQSRTFVRT